MSTRPAALTKDETATLYALAVAVKSAEKTAHGTASALRITRSRTGELRFTVESQS